MTAPGYIPPIAAGWWPKTGRLFKSAGITSAERFGNFVVVQVISPLSIRRTDAFGVVTVVFPDGGDSSSAGAGTLDGGNAANDGGGTVDGGSA